MSTPSHSTKRKSSGAAKNPHSLEHTKASPVTTHTEEQLQDDVQRLRLTEEAQRRSIQEMTAAQEVMKRTLLDVQSKEKHMNELIDASKDAIYTVDKDYKIINYNKALTAAYTALGLTLEKGIDMLQIVEEKDRAQILADYKKAFQGEAFEKTQSFSTHGVEAYYNLGYYPLRNEKGEVHSVAVFTKDVTEMVNARHQSEQLMKEAQIRNEQFSAQEEELRQNMEEMQATQDEMQRKEVELIGQNAALNNAAIVSEVDLQGNILFVNDEFCRLAKYTREELIGKKQSIVRHPDMPASVFEDLWATITKGKVWKGEVKNRARDGSHYWVDASITPVIGANGKPVKYIGVRFDITAQKEAEERMKAQLNAINASYAFIEFDKTGNIMSANDIFLDVMGYSMEQLAGKHHRIFNTSAYVNSREYQEFWEQLNRGIIQKGTYCRITRDGKEVWLDANYTPVKNERGEVVRVIKLAVNVTNFTIGFQASTQFIDELKRGNFNAQLDLRGVTLDGNIAKVTQDLEALSVTLKRVITEVNRVVNIAGKEGQLRERLVLSEVQGAWKELGDSLNSLLVNVSEPVLEINRIITALSMGDLTHRFEMNANGDIKDMANALNIALGNINKLMRNIESNALTVAASSTQMLEKAQSMKSTTTEVSSSISQMAEGAQEQALRIDESSKLVEGILRSADETGAKAEVINGAAEKGQKSCLDGLKIIRKVVSNMTEITNSADITSNSIEVLTNRSEEISRTLRVITDIAAQTNLLALNAAIEAARAGDAGRGFAVVAEEIRKLAEDSRKSAVDIERVIKDVQKDTTAATKAIDKMKDSVVSGTSATKEAEDAFESINTSSNETLSLSKRVLDATKEQKDAIGVVVKNIEKVVVVSEETAAGTHEIASSAQELSKSMNEVSDTGKELSNVAKQLKDNIAQFKLS